VRDHHLESATEVRSGREERLWKAIAITLIDDADLALSKVRRQLATYGVALAKDANAVERFLRESRGSYYEQICSNAGIEPSWVSDRIQKQMDALNWKWIRRVQEIIK
jgi:hypothetical protein